MVDTLKHWVCTRLGISINFDSNTIGNHFFDGKLFFKLLHSYNIVNPEMGLYFCDAKSPEAALKNLRLLCVWFKLLGIIQNEEVLNEIAQRSGPTCVKVLNALYTTLANRHSLPFVTKKKEQQVLCKSDSKYSKSKVKEVECFLKPKEDPLIKPLMESQGIVESYKERDKRLLELCKKDSSERRSKLALQVKEESSENIKHYSCGMSVEECLAQINQFEDKIQNAELDKPITSPAEYLANLKLRVRKQIADNKVQMKLKQKTSREVWCSVLKKQEEEFQNSFSKKLLRQSLYERQLAIRLGQIHYNQQLFLETRQMSLLSSAEKQENVVSSNQYIETFKDKEGEVNDERERILELHRKLYSEKQAAMSERHFSYCTDLVGDVLDFAVNVAQYKETHKEQVPVRLMNDWKLLLLKGLPIISPFEKDVALEKDAELVEGESEYSIATKSVKSDLPTRDSQFGEEETDTLRPSESVEVLEIDKICETIIEQNLTDYLILLGPWVKEIWPEVEDYEEDLNILGHLVHRFLMLKYPLPCPQEPAGLPLSSIRAVINNLNDSRAIEKLKLLLNNLGVKVIDVPTVTNFCIKIYKEEVGISDLPKFHKTEGKKQKSKERKSKEQAKKIKSAKKEKSKGKSKKAHLKADIEKIKEETKLEEEPFKHVETQMPSNYEVVSEEPKHTAAGLLGKEAYELLNTGNALPDILNVQMLIEYLKNVSPLKGWVLLNFPLLCGQVSLFEYLFTGSFPPNDCPENEEIKLKLGLIEEVDEGGESVQNLRISKLLPRPGLMDTGPSFVPYLTHFIQLEIEKQSESKRDILNSDRPKTKPGKRKREKSLLKTERQSLFEPPKVTILFEGEQEENLTEEIVETANASTFYKGFDVYANFLYKTLDLKTIKSLARMILGEINDDGPYRKTSEEIFGEEILTALTPKEKSTENKMLKKPGSKKSAKEKKPQSNQKKESGKTKEKSKKKKHRGNEEEEDSVLSLFDTKEPPENIDEVKQEGEAVQKGETQNEEVEQEPSVEICEAGEPCWSYSKFPIPDDFSKALASFWESIEEVYLSNLNELLYLYRVHDASVIPYRTRVFKQLEEVMNLTDERQGLVTDFQNMLNCIDESMRPNVEMKNELYCEIFDLQNKLWDICDQKKNDSENKRRNIISKNWLTYHYCTLSNIFVSFLQVEVDRFIDTLQFLQDYNLVALEKIPPKNPFEKMIIPRFKYSDFDKTSQISVSSSSDIVEKPLSSPDSVHSKGSSKASKPSRSKTASSKLKAVTNPTIPNTIAVLLQDPDVDPNIKIPYETMFMDLFSNVVDQIQKFTKHAFESVAKEESIFLPSSLPASSKALSSHKGKISRAAVSRDRVSLDKDSNEKASKKKSSNEKALIVDEAALEERKENLNKLFKEWYSAVHNEKDRITFRLNLIKCRFLTDLGDILWIMQLTFHRIYDEIGMRYTNQIRNVDTLIRVLKAAVEEGLQIQPALILSLDKFYIDREKLMFSSPPPPPPTALEEVSKEKVFTIQQLYNFTIKMKYVSPVGIIEEPFVKILEDMAYFGEENGYPNLPKIWSCLTQDEIRRLIKLIFGDTVVIDWRDFVIFALGLRYPTLEEIIEMRSEFLKYDPELNETIRKEDYEKIKFWFEKDLGETLNDDLRAVLAREFLYDLFLVDWNSVNYTALLFAFCKDEDPVEGFGKALALASGLGFILSEDKFYLSVKKDLKDSEVIARQIMDYILMDTMNWALGVVVYEIDDEGNKLPSEYNDYVANNHRFFFCEDRLKPPVEVEKEKTPSPEVSIVEESVPEEPEREGVVWENLIPYDLVLSVLLISVMYHSLSPQELYLQKQIEENLAKVFETYGENGFIQGHVLANTPFIKDLFLTMRKFQALSLEGAIDMVLESRQDSSITNEKVKDPPSLQLDS